MSVEVPVEDLEVDDVVVLPMADGKVDECRVIKIERRINGIKFTGLNSNGVECHWGMNYGAMATRHSAGSVG